MCVIPSAMKHRFSLWLAALSLLTLPLAAQAETIEGVQVPETKTVSGKSLKLNGAGLRTVKLGPVPVKAYVAAFYAPNTLTSQKAVLASKGPLRFDFTFLKGVNQGQVKEAWNAQFRESVSYSYGKLAADQAKFVSFFGALKKGGMESVEIDGNVTRVYDGGTMKGEIAGKDFQKAFLSLWFGSKPVMPELKSALLGQ